MTTKMVLAQPRPVIDTLNTDQWGSEICACTDDVPECCFAYWCYCCFTCIKAKTFGEKLCLPLLDVCGLVPPFTLYMRISMRHRYGIKGTFCNDCLLVTCCKACVWCQMSREMKARTSQINLIYARAF